MIEDRPDLDGWESLVYHGYFDLLLPVSAGLGGIVYVLPYDWTCLWLDRHSIAGAEAEGVRGIWRSMLATHRRLTTPDSTSGRAGSGSGAVN